MRIAIPVWHDRVSPVFDVSRRIRVVDIDGGKVTHDEHLSFEGEPRALKLVKLGIDLLICAAISGPLERSLRASGIEVVADTCGSLREIVRAFASGDTRLSEFRSPGFSCAKSPSERETSPPRWTGRVPR